jgi:hypothetical protein
MDQSGLIYREGNHAGPVMGLSRTLCAPMSDWEPLVHIGAVRGPMALIGGAPSSPTIGLVTRYEYTHTAVTTIVIRRD